MNGRVGRFLVPCLSAIFLFSCSSTPAELAAKHAKRGDEYAQKEKYKEAVIEYKNAVKAGPTDSALHFKLAKAALEARDFPSTYYRRTVQGTPWSTGSTTGCGYHAPSGCA